MSRNILGALVVLVVVAVAQKTDEADKQKLIAIEQKFAAITSFNSPEMTDAFQKYLYDGTSSLLVLFGHPTGDQKPMLLPRRRNQIPTIPTKR
jgi:hypothetical protein